MLELNGTVESVKNPPIEPVALRGVTVPPVVFLRRLRRLLVLRYRAAQYLDEQDLHLLDRCIFATYCDCRHLGAEDDARRYLDEARANARQILADGVTRD